MFRTQPPGFRWLVGGFALLAGCAFVLRFVTDADKPALVFGLICLLLAAYWLILDREPPPGDRQGSAQKLPESPYPIEEWPPDNG